jgi:acyl carrier protein
MGLDIVEVVMRCEETFDVRLEPIRLEQMRTVGDLFELVCEQLNLRGGAPMRAPIAGATLPLIAIPAGGWSKDNVWTKLVQICVDQLQVESDQVNYAASFVDDLGAD